MASPRFTLRPHLHALHSVCLYSTPLHLLSPPARPSSDFSSCTSPAPTPSFKPRTKQQRRNTEPKRWTGARCVHSYHNQRYLLSHGCHKLTVSSYSCLSFRLPVQSGCLLTGSCVKNEGHLAPLAEGFHGGLPDAITSLHSRYRRSLFIRRSSFTPPRGVPWCETPHGDNGKAVSSSVFSCWRGLSHWTTAGGLRRHAPHSYSPHQVSVTADLDGFTRLFACLSFSIVGHTSANQWRDGLRNTRRSRRERWHSQNISTHARLEPTRTVVAVQT